MKKKLLPLLGILLIITAGIFIFQQTNETRNIEKLRAQHQESLDNSPFKETKNLTRQERKDLGIPPNAYNEQMWELTLDPATGTPMPERVRRLQNELQDESNPQRGVGGEAANPWVDRGPNNVGGRTRGVMFDPNDATNSRVFAGGVSGGLWVNNDITNANSSWTQVTSMQANIAVTVIVSDPNNSNTFYIGSGESYTSGDAIGRGIWKSTDAGVTWTNIFGGLTSVTGTDINGIFYINDLIVRDNAGTTELYAAVASAFYGETTNQDHGIDDRGVYKSSDDGATWTRFAEIVTGGGIFKNPNDLEIDLNNNIWLTTTRGGPTSPFGAEIWRSNDGATFTFVNNVVPSGARRRTEIEVSQNDPNKFWIAMQNGSAADLFVTTDAFVTITPMTSEPADVDNGVPDTDYTRGQAFYDLPIEVDANDNIYVGGIDVFRSTDDATTWEQISKWSNNNNLAGLNVPGVHADIHAFVFRPGNDNQAVIATDGGLFYASDLAAANNDPSAINARNTEYNTVQFYYGAIADAVGGAGDDLAAGAQDNGTLFVTNGAAGTNPFIDPVGGDGGYTEIDINGQYAVTTYPGNNHRYLSLTSNSFWAISSGSGGSFINEGALDNNLNILYSNATSGGSRIIERNANFTVSPGSIVSTPLTNALLNNAPSALQVSPFTTTSTTLFAGLRNGRLLRITNADTTPSWTDITGPSFVGSISDIGFGQSEQEIFVTFHNYGVTSIWFTDNGGALWTSIEGNLPDVPVKCVLQNPLIPEELIIGTALGVWATPDYTTGSPVWFQTQNGMRDVPVTDLDVRASDNVILATTYGRGLLTSQFTSAPLSVEENNFANNNISIYPKVSDGNLNVKSNTSLGQGNISVFNLNGQEVSTAALNLNNTTNSLRLNLSAGIYIVKISGESFTLTDKIIIK